MNPTTEVFENYIDEIYDYRKRAHHENNLIEKFSSISPSNFKNKSKNVLIFIFLSKNCPDGKSIKKISRRFKTHEKRS